jgi:altronate hydrolase
MTRAIRFNPSDMVAVVTSDVSPAMRVDVDGDSLIAIDAIPSGHKIATAALSAGEQVIKYGQPIGLATTAIRRGQHVHVHNLRSARLPGRVPEHD